VAEEAQRLPVMNPMRVVPAVASTATPEPDSPTIEVISRLREGRVMTSASTI